MEKANFVSGIFWLLFAALIACLSWRMGLGGIKQPGPGFLYFWSAVILGLLSAITLVGALRRGALRQSMGFMFTGINHRKVIIVVVAQVVFAALLESIGFIIMTFVLFLFLLAVVEKRGWRSALITSAIVTAACYLIFELWLKTQMPHGLLGFIRY